jgi:hypothetical protein
MIDGANGGENMARDMRKSRSAKGGPNLRTVDPAAASAAGRALGSISTPRKAAAARANAAKRKTFGRPPEKDPLTLPWTCGAGTDVEVGTGHKTTCPRGRLLYQRAKRTAPAQESREHGQ